MMKCARQRSAGLFGLAGLGLPLFFRKAVVVAGGDFIDHVLIEVPVIVAAAIAAITKPLY